MGKNSKIPWTKHSWNPWIGCHQIRSACKNCYAKAFAQRMGLDVFGKDRPRKLFVSDKHWREPLLWDAEAARQGGVQTVFLESLGDFFDPHPDLKQARRRVFDLLHATPHLMWLVLTKRIRMVSPMLHTTAYGWPSNAFLGISVCRQEDVEEDMYVLRDLKSSWRCSTFVSVEPMLEEIDMRPWLGDVFGPDWVICGAESMPGKKLGRPIELDWVRNLRDQCKASEVPFFYKQGPVDGKLVELPELDGEVLNQFPLRLQ